LSRSAVVLAAARLQQSLITQIERDTFCAPESLEALAIHARDIQRDTTSSDHRILAFVLETILRRVAYDVSDRPVQLSETVALRRLFQNPITQAADCLAGKNGNPIAIVDALIKAVSERLPPLNP
jgi:hypothetical protein